MKHLITGMADNLILGELKIAQKNIIHQLYRSVLFQYQNRIRQMVKNIFKAFE